MKEYNMTEGSISKKLFTFLFPVLFGSVFQYLYGTIDAIIVGQYVGTVGLAAVGGSTSVIVNLLIGLFIGISSGASVVISQNIGSGNELGIKKSIHTSAAITLIIAILLTIVGLLFIPIILNLIHTPQDILVEALNYLRIYFGGIVGMIIYTFGSSFLQALGDSKRPMYILFFCCLLNIVLDYIFVAKCHFGVSGAAIATVISQFVSAIYVIVCLIRRPFPQKLKIRDIHLDTDIFKNILRIGIPAGIQSIIYAVSNLLIQDSINGFGTNTIAAFSSYEKVEALFLMMIESFGVAITTFAGQNYGAGKIDRFRKGVLQCIGLCFIFTCVVSILLMICKRPILGLFSTDETIITLGCTIMYCIVPFYFTCIVLTIIPGALRSIGDAFNPILITCLGVGVLRIVFILLGLKIYYDFRIICYSYPVSWGITSLVFLFYYRMKKIE